jgi:CBS domain containing-hemolysin-like protein
VPEPGETVRFRGLEFRADRMQGRRIVSVRIRPTEAKDTPPKRVSDTAPPS